MEIIDAQKWGGADKGEIVYVTKEDAVMAFPAKEAEIKEWISRERKYIQRTEKNPLQPWLW